MEQDIENIILNKSFIELDQSEKELISEWVSNEDEFNQLKSVFQATDLFKEQQNEQLNPVVKQRLDVRFREKYDKERLVWYNKLWLFLWPEDTGLIRKPLLQLATVGLIVLMVTPFLFQNSTDDYRLASNDKPIKEEVAKTEERSKEAEKSVNLKREIQKNQQASGASEPKIDKLTESPVMEAPSEDKNLGFDVPKDNSEKSIGAGGWELNEEVAESEAMEDAFVDQDLSVADEAQKQDQTVFAGAVMEQDDLSDRKLLDSESRSAGYKTAKKVDPEKTIDLLTALY